MSYTYPIRTLADLGHAISAARKAAGLTATAVARRANRSRDILHRLERGEDVSASSLLDLLRAMNHHLGVLPSRPPTLDEVRARFADDEDDAGPAQRTSS